MYLATPHDYTRKLSRNPHLFGSTPPKSPSPPPSKASLASPETKGGEEEMASGEKEEEEESKEASDEDCNREIAWEKSEILREIMPTAFSAMCLRPTGREAEARR